MPCGRRSSTSPRPLSSSLTTWSERDNDTGGEFVQVIRNRGSSLLRSPLLPKLWPAGHRRQFAIGVSGGLGSVTNHGQRPWLLRPARHDGMFCTVLVRAFTGTEHGAWCLGVVDVTDARDTASDNRLRGEDLRRDYAPYRTKRPQNSFGQPRCRDLRRTTLRLGRETGTALGRSSAKRETILRNTNVEE